MRLQQGMIIMIIHYELVENFRNLLQVCVKTKNDWRQGENKAKSKLGSHSTAGVILGQALSSVTFGSQTHTKVAVLD